MVLFNLLMAILYPLAPVMQIIAGVRYALGCFFEGFEDPAYREELSADYAQLSRLDCIFADTESLLHIAIWHMARFKLGLPYREHRRTGRARPGNRLTVASVFGRLVRVARMLGELERLAVRRAWRLKRLLDANPLGLADHRPVDAVSCASLFAVARIHARLDALRSAPRIRAPP